MTSSETLTTSDVRTETAQQIQGMLLFIRLSKK